MSNESKTTAPTRMESIERLVRNYGNARVIEYNNDSPTDRERAEEALAQVLAAWQSGVVTTDPTLDERLRVAYNPDLDYGPNPGPSVGPVPATAADLTASFPADPHAVAAMGLTPTGQLAEPVTVSDERVVEILTEANYHLHHGEIGADDAYLSGLDEFRRVTRKLTEDGHESFSEVELVDGTLLRYVAMRGWQRVQS